MFPIKISSVVWGGLPLLLLLGLFRPTGAIVDSSSPEISGFKLRHVDLEAEARKRAEQPVRSLWQGALHMKESLFVDANYVKCPAYGHLFKLIKHQNKEMKYAPTNNKQPVRQSLIQSLAIVVTYDRVLYQKLFQRSLQISADHFLEAALELEGRPEAEAREAWLDLLCCLKEYIAPLDKLALKFLEDPKRARALDSMSRFMSIPVEPESAPQGLVSNLIKRYEKRDIVVDPNMYESARIVVLGFDDELTAQQRIEIGQQLSAAQGKAPEVAASAQHPLVVISGQEQAALEKEEAAAAKPAGAPPKSPPSEQEIKEIRLAEDIEIAVPASATTPSQTNAEASESAEASETANIDGPTDQYSLDQLAILKFIKMRLESSQRTPRISMRLAFDFRSHFEHLLKARLDLGCEVGREAHSFRLNETNLKLYKRVQRVIEEYLKIVEVLAEIKTLNDKLESLEEFGGPLERLNRLLDNFDSSFDLNDIRRLQAIWKLKYKEYSTMQNFIDQDGSW